MIFFYFFYSVITKLRLHYFVVLRKQKFFSCENRIIYQVNLSFFYLNKTKETNKEIILRERLHKIHFVM